MYQPPEIFSPGSTSYESDVMVILHPKYAENLPAILPRLQQAGLTILRTIPEDGVIEGTIDAAKIPSLRQQEGIAYLRDIFDYTAENP